MSADRNTKRRGTHQPLEPGRGVGFVTLKLVREGQAWAYRPTRFAWVFSAVFLYLGYAALAGALLLIRQSLLGALAFLCAGGLFVSIGRHLRRFFSDAARFDPRTRRIDIPVRPSLLPCFEPWFETAFSA